MNGDYGIMFKLNPPCRVEKFRRVLQVEPKVLRTWRLVPFQLIHSTTLRLKLSSPSYANPFHFFNLTLLTIICTIFSNVWPKTVHMAVLSSFSLIFSFFRLSFGLLPRTQAKHSIYMLRYFAILQLRLATSSRLAYGYFSAGLPYFIFFSLPSAFCSFAY